MDINRSPFLEETSDQFHFGRAAHEGQRMDNPLALHGEGGVLSAAAFHAEAYGGADVEYDADLEVLRQVQHLDEDEEEVLPPPHSNARAVGGAASATPTALGGPVDHAGDTKTSADGTGEFLTFSVSAGDQIPPPPPQQSPSQQASSASSPAQLLANAYAVAGLSPQLRGTGGSGYVAVSVESGGAMTSFAAQQTLAAAHRHAAASGAYPPPPPPPGGLHSYAETPSFLPLRSPPYAYTPIPSSHSKPPPPSYDTVASSTTSLHTGGGRSTDISPLSGPMAFYTAHQPPPAPPPPPPPAVTHQDTLLVRNSNGVFLLQPALKPAPPYTPPVLSFSGATPPSPLPQYTLPPPAAAGAMPRHHLAADLPGPPGPKYTAAAAAAAASNATGSTSFTGMPISMTSASCTSGAYPAPSLPSTSPQQQSLPGYAAAPPPYAAAATSSDDVSNSAHW